MKTIVITGCSWGAGEWGGDGQPFAHAGLAQYFSESGYNVVNLSCTGSGNFKLIQPLSNFLEINLHLDIEHIFVLQTDIGRDFDQKWWANVRNELLDVNTPNLEYRISEMYCQFYDKLNYTMKNRKKKVHLIGGLTDLNMDFKNDFENINFLIPSWTQLCDPATPLCYVINHNGFADFLDKRQHMEYIIATHTRLNYFENHPEFFWPDGTHPNRYGHKILYDAVKTKLNL